MVALYERLNQRPILASQALLLALVAGISLIHGLVDAENASTERFRVVFSQLLISSQLLFTISYLAGVVRLLVKFLYKTLILGAGFSIVGLVFWFVVSTTDLSAVGMIVLGFLGYYVMYRISRLLTF